MYNKRVYTIHTCMCSSIHTHRSIKTTQNSWFNLRNMLSIFLNCFIEIKHILSMGKVYPRLCMGRISPVKSRYILTLSEKNSVIFLPVLWFLSASIGRIWVGLGIKSFSRLPDRKVASSSKARKSEDCFYLLPGPHWHPVEIS